MFGLSEKVYEHNKRKTYKTIKRIKRKIRYNIK